MKSILAGIALAVSLLPAARAQQGVDDRYIAISAVVDQATSLAETGEPKQALAGLTDAQAQLQQFQRIYPSWHPDIVSYRLDKLAKKIAEINAKLTAAAGPPPTATNAEATATQPKISPQEASLQAQLQTVQAQLQALQAQLQAAQAQNEVLQAKLKEALASQPAVIDSGELAKARDQNRSLMKENDLLKANAMVDNDTNRISAWKRQLAIAQDQVAAEQARAQKLAAEKADLQQELQRRKDQEENELARLRSQNDQLKSQLAAVQAATNDAAELTAQLQTAIARISSLQSTVTVATLEKGGLENRLKQQSAELDELHAANYEGRLRDLTEQRDKLAQQLADARKQNPAGNPDAQVTALTNELATLQARLEAAEAKPSPYSAEELALLNPAAPQPASTRHSIHELPPGAAELVHSAQRHFANREFVAAAADYTKILKLDPKNALVLANLATIELQENQFADAEKHITAALAEEPDDAYNLSTLGYLEFREEKYDEALNALSRAAKIDPNNPEIQNYLGVTLSHKGLRVQAEAALRKAIQIDPSYAPAHNNLAVIYLNQTPPLPLLARWHYQKALAAGQPRNPDLERLLAEKGAPVNAQ